MSRVGKKIIAIPPGVTVSVKETAVTVTGPKGTLTVPLGPEFAVSLEQGVLALVPNDVSMKNISARWGLMRSLLANCIIGVTQGYTKSLEIIGIGFKAATQGQKLTLNVGFSHPIAFPIPQGIIVAVEKNIITVSGIDKQLVGEIAAQIRAVKPPEPYKGKGIKYADEVIRRKMGKVVKSAA